jgi:predicted outer membrane lipoprotein
MSGAIVNAMRLESVNPPGRGMSGAIVNAMRLESVNPPGR